MGGHTPIVPTLVEATAGGVGVAVAGSWGLRDSVRAWSRRILICATTRSGWVQVALRRGGEGRGGGGEGREGRGGGGEGRGGEGRELCR